MRITARSHQGLVRTNNEDVVHYDVAQGFAVLADGMGGLLAGEQASSVALATACAELSAPMAPDDAKPLTDFLAQVIENAHRAVQAHARKLNYLGRMGTTLLLCKQGPDGMCFSHVGDSRLYAFGGDELQQLTTDHTLAQRLIDEGVMKPGAAGNVANQHVLTQAVGLTGDCEAQTGHAPAGQRLLLCSDGLSDLVGSSDIAKILSAVDLDDCADRLVKAALDRGGRDNVSVVVIDP